MRAVADLLPRVAVDPSGPAPGDLRSLFPSRPSAVWLEIGFGGAEHLVWQAKANPDVGLIGCEPFEEGLVKALTAIDVNSGRYTAATGLEETSVKINLEAVEEIVYQLRLRGTGGLIVIDFIHLNNPENIQKVLDALNAGFAKDRVPTQISGMSEFGLVEMTRKRVREPLDKLLTERAFPHGRPRRKTCATVANDLLRKIAGEAAAAPGRALVARASPEVVDWLERGNPYLVERLRRRVPAEVSLIGDPAYSREKIDVGALQ